MNTEQTGERPRRPAQPVDVADWHARTFRSARPLVRRPPAELSLDDEVANDPLADPDATRAHIAALRAAGRL